MAERALDAWIGKDVWVVIGDEQGEPYFGILEGWDERGVILRYTERAIRMREERGSEGPSKPALLLFPWTMVRHIGIYQDRLEGG